MGYRGEDISIQVIVLNLEDKNNLGITKLYYAVQAGDLGLVKSLIQSAASINFRDKNGQTPLYYAIERGFIKCMEVLVKHGTGLYIINNSRFSLFLQAIVTRQEGATTGLLFIDANANVFSADRKSILAQVASLRQPLTTKILIKYYTSISNT